MEGKEDLEPEQAEMKFPKLYSHVCAEKPKEYSDYKKSYVLHYG